MRKVLAIIAALMLSAIILSPAMGYTIQSGGNQSYSISSYKVNYSISSGIPAQDITPGMIQSETAPTAAVKATRVPYSIKLGTAMPYSVKLESSANFANEGEMALPSVASLGSTANTEAVTTTQPAPGTTANAPATVPAAASAPAKFSIMGTVFDDSNSNGAKEASEMGLAGWTLNLEQPAGAVIANTTTSRSGNYAFNDLSPGEYVVSAVLPMGWSIVMPADGKYTVNLTDNNVIDQNFAVMKLPPENVTPPTNAAATENVTTLNSTAAA
jgi:hypothetical protein